ncbi:hypothetical protein MRX96_012000 [Rhipicephalus microplus]
MANILREGERGGRCQNGDLVRGERSAWLVRRSMRATRSSRWSRRALPMNLAHKNLYFCNVFVHKRGGGVHLCTTPFFPEHRSPRRRGSSRRTGLEIVSPVEATCSPIPNYTL